MREQGSLANQVQPPETTGFWKMGQASSLVSCSQLVNALYGDSRIDDVMLSIKSDGMTGDISTRLVDPVIMEKLSPHRLANRTIALLYYLINVYNKEDGDTYGPQVFPSELEDVFFSIVSEILPNNKSSISGPAYCSFKHVICGVGIEAQVDIMINEGHILCISQSEDNLSNFSNDCGVLVLNAAVRYLHNNKTTNRLTSFNVATGRLIEISVEDRFYHSGAAQNVLIGSVERFRKRLYEYREYQ
jgi:hypothetical protein